MNSLGLNGSRLIIMGGCGGAPITTGLCAITLRSSAIFSNSLQSDLTSEAVNSGRSSIKSRKTSILRRNDNLRMCFARTGSLLKLLMTWLIWNSSSPQVLITVPISSTKRAPMVANGGLFLLLFCEQFVFQEFLVLFQLFELVSDR
jgi:hypothetical protein